MDAHGKPRKCGAGLCYLFALGLSASSAPSGTSADGPMRLLKDLVPGGASSGAGWLTEASGRLFFTAATFASGRELWVSDGTEQGTSLVKDLRSGPASGLPKDLFVLHGALLFTASDGVAGREWWTSDGTEGGTRLLKDIRPGPTGGIEEGNSQSSTPAVAFQGYLYFLANDGIYGSELWRTDGTEEGTVLFKDIAPGPSSGSPNGFGIAGDALYFFAGDEEHGREIWTSDGTEAGTRLVKDIAPGPPSSVNSPLAGVAGRFVFSADDGVHGVEPWVTDGTEQGTRLLKDLRPGPDGGYPSNPAALDGLVLFAADDGEHGLEMWRSDATEEGTTLLKDIYPGPGNSVWHDPVSTGEAIFWGAIDPEHGAELWTSDGTEVGTALVADIHVGPGDANPSALTPLQGALLFNADDGEHGLRLWRTGRDAETSPVQSIFIVQASPGPNAVVGSWLFLSAADLVHGAEPWTGHAAIVAGKPERAIEDLTADVKALHLPAGLEAALVAKLNAAAARWNEPGGISPAIRLLEAFEHLVRAQTPAGIAPGPAAELIGFAHEIVELLSGFGPALSFGPHPPRTSRTG